MSWNGHWSDERIKVLKARWAEGLSATQIAQELGGVTRNAVIGKIHRLGLSKRTTGYQWASKGQPRPKRKATYTSGYSTLHRIAIKQEKSAFNEVELLTPDFLGITFNELNETTCRFPKGTSAPYLFCGQPVMSGSSYCPHCHRVAYTGIPERPERKGFARSFAPGSYAA